LVRTPVPRMPKTGSAIAWEIRSRHGCPRARGRRCRCESQKSDLASPGLGFVVGIAYITLHAMDWERRVDWFLGGGRATSGNRRDRPATADGGGRNWDGGKGGGNVGDGTKCGGTKFFRWKSVRFFLQKHRRAAYFGTEGVYRVLNYRVSIKFAHFLVKIPIWSCIYGSRLFVFWPDLDAHDIDISVRSTNLLLANFTRLWVS
jgi:hypothetical protein